MPEVNLSGFPEMFDTLKSVPPKVQATIIMVPETERTLEQETAVPVVAEGIVDPETEKILEQVTAIPVVADMDMDWRLME